MRNLFIRLSALLLALALIALAVSNRAHIPLQLPMTELAITVPLYAIFFAGMFFGTVLTGLVLTPPRLRGFMARKRAEKRAEKAEHRLVHTPDDNFKKRAVMLSAIDKAQGPGQASSP